MTETALTPRLQDFLLLALFLAMAAIVPDLDPSEIVLILLLGALQITESRFISLDTVRGKVLWNLLKLGAGYLLIGYTHGVQSNYYLVLLFPVISAAGTLGVFISLAFTGLACALYLSFLFYVDWNVYHIDAPEIAELARRVLFLAISGLLVNTLALALRLQSLRYKSLADQLTETNRSLREAEAQVRRAERLAALGQLTAGLAHELRNPLGTIKASSEMLERNLVKWNEPGGDEIARELAGYISSEVDRTNSLISRFLDFARPLEIRRAVATLDDVISRSVADSRREAAQRGVTLEQVAGTQPLTFAFDAELMERVFFNLLQNAVQASPRDALVSIETLRETNAAVVKVVDHGSGIEPGQMESIFNPFFTTKPEGNGLGLAIVAKIVDEHRGKINAESALGKGTTFTVSLPMVDQS